MTAAAQQTDRAEIARLVYDPSYDTWHGQAPIGAWYMTGVVDAKEPDFDPADSLSAYDRAEANVPAVMLATEFLSGKGWLVMSWTRDMTATSGQRWIGYGQRADAR